MAAPTKIVTGKVRLSYAHLFEPYSNQPDQDPKYSVTLLIPKSDKETLAKIEAARKAAIELGKAKQFQGKVPPNLVNTLHDGDEEKDTDEHPEYAGMMYIAVSSKQKPGVVDRSNQQVFDASEVYSGCYARVSINAYPYSYAGKKGISFGLNNVQKLADGERFGGSSNPEDDFEALDDEASSLL